MALLSPVSRLHPGLGKHLRTALLLFLALLTLGGCQEPERPLRIGINPWPGYDFLYLAAHKGWFGEAGVEVEIVEFTSLGDSRRAFERGQTDVFGGTTVELLLARHQSAREARAFYAVNWSKGADEILARPPVTSVAGLRGKRVGVEPASLDLLVLAVALQRAGVPFDAVERVPLAQAEMPEAMANERIHAAVTYPPASLDIHAGSRAETIFSTEQAPRSVLDLLITDAQVLRERRGDLTRVVRTFHRAVEYARAHPEEAHRIMARREGVSPQDIENLLGRIEVLDLEAQEGLWGDKGAVANSLRQTADTLLAAHEIGGSHAEIPTLLSPAIVRQAGRRQ